MSKTQLSTNILTAGMLLCGECFQGSSTVFVAFALQDGIPKNGPNPFLGIEQ